MVRTRSQHKKFWEEEEKREKKYESYIGTKFVFKLCFSCRKKKGTISVVRDGWQYSICKACKDEGHSFSGGIKPCVMCNIFVGDDEDMYEDDYCEKCYYKSGLHKHCRTKQCARK